MKPVHLLQELRQDLLLGVRRLGRSPGFTLAALFALTLGIGAAGSMFMVVNAVLLRSIPFADPDRILLLEGTFRQGQQVEDWPISYVDFRDWFEQGGPFQEMAAFGEGYAFVRTGGDEPERLEGELVSSAYFHLLGLRPAIGRFFSPQEDRADGARNVAVLGFGLWKRRFGGDPSLIGRPLVLNGLSYTVVGVAPPAFRGLSDQAEVWVPTATIANTDPDYLSVRRIRWLSAVGRLKTGVTLRQAQVAMDQTTGALSRALPDSNQGIGVRLRPLEEAWFGPLRKGLLILLAGAGLILLIACINVTNLFLVRALARQGTFAVQIALGADRRRFIQQVIGESVVLALIGCFSGLLLARWATQVLVAASHVNFRSFLRFNVDPVVVLASLGAALLCSLVFGLAAAWSARRLDLVPLLKESKSTSEAGRHRVQGGIVVAEVTLSLVLLTGAGLMIKGFHTLASTDLGFQSAGLLTLSVDLDEGRYPENPKVVKLIREALEGISAQPGVRSAAVEGPDMPTADYWFAVAYTLEGLPGEAPDGTVQLTLHSVSPGYFATLGSRIIRGRDFNASDTVSSVPVVIVSRRMAERYWPGENPVGKRLKWGAADSKRPWQTIVGVADDLDHRGLLGEERPASDLYFAALQYPLRAPLRLNFLVRVASGIEPESLARGVETTIRSLDPDLVVYDVMTLEQRLDRQVANARFQVVLFVLFSTLALLLSFIGVYGVSASVATERTREMAIRMAFGASRGHVIRLVLLRGAALAITGVMLGIFLSLVVGRSAAGLLPGADTADPAILAGAALVIFILVLMASCIPLRGLLRLDAALVFRAK